METENEISNVIKTQLGLNWSVQIEAGAQVVLTQPPLIWHTFSDWWSDVHRSALSLQTSPHFPSSFASSFPLVVDPEHLTCLCTLVKQYSGQASLPILILTFRL